MSENGASGGAGEAEPLIPYADPAEAPEGLRTILDTYMARMGFLPNALGFYLHRPEIAEVLWSLNDRVMRHPSSTLDPFLKRKLATVASKINRSAYCVAHHCAMLERGGGESEGWGLSDAEITALLSGEAEPENEMERVCYDYVRAASQGPGSVSADVLERLKRHLTPPQIVELACVVGFWKFYNTVHESLNVPIEPQLLEASKYAEL